MFLAPSQVARFWRDWSVIVAKNHWPHPQAEQERRALLERAGFTSLKLVDRNKGFTAVLKELAILQENIAGMIHADGNDRRQKIFLITHKGAPGYWRKIAQDRFGTTDLESLPDASLDQLLYTLSDRQVEQHHPGTQARRARQNRARRQAAKETPEARIKLEAPEGTQNECGGYYCSEEHGHIDCHPAPAAEPARNLDPTNAPW